MLTVVLPCLLVVIGNPPESVAIVVQPEATSVEHPRQRLRAAVRDALPIPSDQIVDDAWERLRRAVAYEISPGLIRKEAAITADVDAARAYFRAGELEQAQALLDRALDRLAEAPGLPGAARIAYGIHVLGARIAWTRGDLEASRLSILEALTLDPQARISTRRVPPDFAAEYELVQEELLAGASSWPRWAAPGDPQVLVEIDGRAGMRAVPPGEHFVVLRRLGHAPQAQTVDTSERLPVFESPLRFGPAPRGGRDVAAVCERLGVQHVLVGMSRGTRWGLQAFECGVGFASPSFVTDDVLVSTMGRVFEEGAAETPYQLRDPWPAPPSVAVSRTVPPPSVAREPDTTKKPWYRRPWIWATIAAGLVAGVTVGAVFGARAAQTPGLQVEVPGQDFIEP